MRATGADPFRGRASIFVKYFLSVRCEKARNPKDLLISRAAASRSVRRHLVFLGCSPRHKLGEVGEGQVHSRAGTIPAPTPPRRVDGVSRCELRDRQLHEADELSQGLGPYRAESDADVVGGDGYYSRVVVLQQMLPHLF